MNIIKTLEDNTIIVTNYNYKINILKELNKSDKLLNINFITKEELIKKFYFYYDEKTIYFLMDKHNLKRDIAEIYLKNMCFIEDKDYNSAKLNELNKLKKELIDNNLLIYDNLFLNYIKNKKIVFYNYNYFTAFEKNLINELKKYTEVEIIEKEYSTYKHSIYEFSTIFEEVEYVAKEIFNLIEKGISLNKIKLTNLDNDYNDIITRIFAMYNLKINFKDEKLISTKIAHDFLTMSGSIEKKVEELTSKYKNSSTLEKIIKIVNKYITFEKEDIVNEMITYDLKNAYLKKENYKNTIEVIDYLDYQISDDMYIFMLSFNQNKIPIVYKDEEFITDDLKENLPLESILSKNKTMREITIKNILNIKNLTITYKNSTPFGTFYPSNLIADLNFETETKKLDFSYSYSPLADKLTLSKYLDNYVKTGVVTDELKLLYSNYEDVTYNLYNNKFTGISKNLFKEYVNGKFNLAYSSMDSFYKCPFRYYLSHILKLNIYEESFEAYIGSMFHYVLENSLKNNKEVNTLIDLFIQENERILTKKEQFFINKLRKEIEFVHKVILEQIENSNLKKMLFEERVEVLKTGDITVTFKGFIDKIMYEEKEGSVVAAIIDYKTGYTDINLGFVPHGLSMQLPVYLYLAKNSNKLINIKFAGFYLQRILSGPFSIDKKKSLESIKKENLLLYGYSNEDEDILHEFDRTYKESRFIKSMKLDKNGHLSRFAKTLNNEQIENLIDITDKKINEAIKSICNCNFSISPKKTEKELLGCKFCNYSDICFKENSDEVLIYEDKDLSFLGGEEDA